MTWRPVPTPKEQAFAALKASLSHGPTLWDGGEVYGTPQRNSLHLAKEYFTAHPEDADSVVLCIKSGVNPDNMFEPQQDRAGIHACIERCLALLDGTKKLDIFETVRQDKNVPVEVTVAAIAEFVEAGKVGGIGLSEVSAETIRRAARVHPIAVVEVELSLWATDVLHNGIAEACKELGIPMLAYSPLGRGFLVRLLTRFQPSRSGPMLVC
jgi:pyridoxine 4-dehydrogenase